MAQITNRRIMLSRYSDNVGVMLSWNEEGKDSVSDMQSKHLHFYDVATWGKVDQIINRIVGKWGRVFISASHMAAVSANLDENSARFDWLLENVNQNDENFFVSIEGL